MRIAIISDTHLPRGARRLPSGCVQRLESADLILHAGDIATAVALGEIEALGPPVRAVHGNVDAAELGGRLPPERVVDAAGARIGMVHDAGPAAGRLERLRRRFPDADAAVFGHSHLPLHEERAGFQIFNPGSPTERRRAEQRSMGLMRVSRNSIEFEHVPLE
jgi:putative phosphoesterase